jgi:hypothetical protein
VKPRRPGTANTRRAARTLAADGLHKTEAVLDALRGRFLDILVTNKLVALALLDFEGSGGRHMSADAVDYRLIQAPNIRVGPCEGSGSPDCLCA